MRSFISRYMHNEIINFIFIAATVGLIIYLSFGQRALSGLCDGYLVGIIYFLLLLFGIKLTFRVKSSIMGMFHFLFFTVRYTMVGIILFGLIKYENTNVFTLVLGFIVIHFIIMLGAFKKRPSFGGGA